ncbi:unnamed protein product [Bursaphelenchus okinawaensis]|uniref:G-protein coupled receptors family 1 profile domain-containing protein n=1 Tax=Bursaphelenchus okinawaensis TaxID=465554 RepID=A0A811KKD7_9BILA|nr:unnamed protein product [Bursaphelenchus okinawaensis]CAG9104712.1 unnamed protein product [Bursaphelenchus okinawaensis]
MNLNRSTGHVNPLQHHCHLYFGSDLTSSECINLISLIIQLDKSGVPKCFPERRGPLVEHNEDYYKQCAEYDHQIARYVLPILQILCFFGNAFNLLIYRLPYFDGSSSVNFLRVKTIANFIFVESRILEVLHSFTYEANSQLEPFYWKTKPFIITVANISGTLSTWLTLFVTIETALCVILPFSFRQLCTRRTTMTVLCSSIVMSTALHSTFFYTHSVRPVISVKWPNGTKGNSTLPVCWYISLAYSLQGDTSTVQEVLEKIYYWSQTMFSIVIPNIVMLVCSVLIVTKFTFKELGEAFSQRRRCVIRLTVATTLSHLLFEGPALLTFGAAAIKGTDSDQHNLTICILNHTNNLLSVINATIPFFVFLACNQQFRNMSTIYLKAQTELRREKREALMAQALNRSRLGGTVNHSKISNL